MDNYRFNFWMDSVEPEIVSRASRVKYDFIWPLDYGLVIQLMGEEGYKHEWFSYIALLLFVSLTVCAAD